MKDKTFPLDEYDAMLVKGLVFLILLITLLVVLLSSGCLGVSTGDVTTKALDVLAPVFVIEGSTQWQRMYPGAELTPAATPIPTPVLTVATPMPTPTIAARQVDPYSNGERWEKQWFKHTAILKTNQYSDASPKKPLEFGIVIYDHKFADSYTWWSDHDGQYYKEIPRPGYKFLFVWVHEEVFGDGRTHIPLMNGYNEESFIAQYKDKLFFYNDTGHDPVNRILDFDTKPDYYRISRTTAFGYTRIYIGTNFRYGGWIAQKNYDLYIGQGNAWDGYIVYQVPASATDSDMVIVGNFAPYGNAFWRFNIYAGS